MSAVEKWWNREKEFRTLYDRINLTAFPISLARTHSAKVTALITTKTISTRTTNLPYIVGGGGTDDINYDLSGLSLTAPAASSSQLFQSNAISINNWNLSDNIRVSDTVSGIGFDGENGGDWTHPGCVVLLIIIYGIIVFGGILGNASLVITLCSKPSGRLRNPLLVALCIADLLVAGISAPSTIVTLAVTLKSWNLPSIGCKIVHYLQSMPVAASTISFLMLSLDRYATVKHPSLAQLRQRRHLHSILAIISWIGASIICIPILLAYRIATTSSIPATGIITKDGNFPSNSRQDGGSSTSSASASSLPLSSSSFVHHKTFTACYPDYGSSELQTSFIITHTILVFIFPGLGIILNHLGVRRKLCALSLTARAAHGELPLPMPILRRPTHMIIVTGMANAARGVVSNDSSDDDEEDVRNGEDKNFMMETIIRSSPKSPRVMREIRAQQQRQRLEKKAPAPELPLPQTSTLRARRKLANMLVAAAIIFIICWTPHVLCVLLTEFGHKQYCTKTISYFSLLIGYSHSAISPVMYWALNHNTLRQSPCAPFIRLRAIQRFLRVHFRSPAAPPPPSSTNEAALGAFNPRYIKTTPKQYRAQASSHYLY